MTGARARHARRSIRSAAIAIASLTSLVACSSAPAADRPQLAVSTPGASPIEPALQSFRHEDWAVKRAGQIHALLQDRARLRAANVLFIGDSITQFWAETGLEVWRRNFDAPGAPYRGIDLGFAGDRTENLLMHLLDRAHGGDGFLDDPALDPGLIVLLIGVNNTWKTDGPVVEDVVAGNVAVIAQLRRLRPRATIIVQSLLPAESRDHDQKYIRPINRALVATVAGLGPQVRWLDIYDLFTTPDDGPAPRLFRDGVHPSLAGYEIWSGKLVAALEAARPAGPPAASKP